MDQILDRERLETINPQPGQTEPPPRRLRISPLNQRRWANFKANRRGYWSLWIFLFLFVGSLLAGVFGTGLYPIFGPRVWCRNFCPMAAILGIVQKFGRFRIRVKADMCISCGNCSTYCEMGIDVRAYAQRGQDIVRSSCVGCGICSAVCPRGVLNLENASENSRVMVAPEVLLGNK